MKKLAFLLLTVILTVSLCGVLWADDDDNDHPIPSWVDPHVRNMNLFSGSSGTNNGGRTGNGSNVERGGTSSVSDEWYVVEYNGEEYEAEYRVVRWSHSGNENYTLEIESKYGEKRTVNGKSGETTHLPMPIQFTVPQWVENMHVDINPNFRILPDGNARLLNKGIKDFRVAYPGNQVLLINGKGLTLWIR